MMKPLVNFKLLSFFVIAWPFFAANALESEFTTTLFTNAYAPMSPSENEGSNLLQAGGQAWLNYSARTENGFAANVTGTARVYPESIVPHLPKYEFGLREAFLQSDRREWSFKVGRMLQPWGKSDVINPTDVLGAWDYRVFSPDNEVRRIAADSVVIEWLPQKVRCAQGGVRVRFRKSGRILTRCKKANVTYTRKGWSVQGVWTPIYPQSRLLVPPSVLLAGVSIAEAPERAPTLNDSEGALKFKFSGSGWDASLLAFRGWDHFPSLLESSRTVTGPTTVDVSLVPTFHRLTVAGGDFSANVGEWVMTFEAAYKQTENAQGENRFVAPSSIEAVSGVETGLGDFWRVKLQGIWRYYPRFEQEISDVDPISGAIVAANRVLQGAQFQSQPGATLQIIFDDEESGWRAEVTGATNFEAKDVLARGLVGYRWSDEIESVIGADYADGPSGTTFGAQRSLNAFFFETKIWF